MEYVVFENLVLRASSTGATAWSRSIDAGARNGAMFEVTLRSVSKSSGATLQAILQGSNDLQKWHSITQGSLATAPGRLTVQHDEAVPYRYERLCVIATRSSAPLTPNVNVAATITTFDLST